MLYAINIYLYFAAILIPAVYLFIYCQLMLLPFIFIYAICLLLPFIDTILFIFFL